MHYFWAEDSLRQGPHKVMRGTDWMQEAIKASNSKDLGGTQICIRAAIGHTMLDIVLFGQVETIIYDIYMYRERVIHV